MLNSEVNIVLEVFQHPTLDSALKQGKKVCYYSLACSTDLVQVTLCPWSQPL